MSDHRADLLALAAELEAAADTWAYKARLLAATHPAAFYVMLGCTLPVYQAELSKLSEVAANCRALAADLEQQEKQS